MAVYFGGDNIVWASQAGILSNKGLVAKAQKASLYGWAGGSVCAVINELYELQGEDLVIVWGNHAGAAAWSRGRWCAWHLCQGPDSADRRARPCGHSSHVLTTPTRMQC